MEIGGVEVIGDLVEGDFAGSGGVRGRGGGVVGEASGEIGGEEGFSDAWLADEEGELAGVEGGEKSAEWKVLSAEGGGFGGL